MNRKQKMILLGGSVAYNSVAQAFFTAAGIADPTQKTAINNFCITLNSYGLLTEAVLSALWPIVGGDATKHSYNLMNPATYPLAFTGGLIHSSGGMLPNGTTGFADTGFDSSVKFTDTAGSLGLYSRTAGQGGYDMASCDAGDNKNSMIITRFSNDTAYFGTGASTFNNSQPSVDGRGFFCASRADDTHTKGYINGVNVTNGIDDGVGAGNIYLGACNKNGTASYFSNHQIALAYATQVTLSDAQIANLYTAVQAFQTALGRQV